MEITPELRQAVAEYDCQRLGHEVVTTKAIRFNDDGKLIVDSPEEEPDKYPYIYCKRCNRTWMVSRQSGIGYDNALKNLYFQAQEIMNTVAQYLGQQEAKKKNVRDTQSPDGLNQ